MVPVTCRWRLVTTGAGWAGWARLLTRAWMPLVTGCAIH